MTFSLCFSIFSGVKHLTRLLDSLRVYERKCPQLSVPLLLSIHLASPHIPFDLCAWAFFNQNVTSQKQTRMVPSVHRALCMARTELMAWISSAAAKKEMAERKAWKQITRVAGYGKDSSCCLSLLHTFYWTLCAFVLTHPPASAPPPPGLPPGSGSALPFGVWFCSKEMEKGTQEPY